jgi:hypothetical protein
MQGFIKDAVKTEVRALMNVPDEILLSEVLRRMKYDNEKLKQENKILKEALAFYADEKRWQGRQQRNTDQVLLFSDDAELFGDFYRGGKRARTALKETSNENSK